MSPQAIHDDTKITITSDGAPNYRILVKAPNYKQAEEELKSSVGLVLKLLKKEGSNGSLRGLVRSSLYIAKSAIYLL